MSLQITTNINVDFYDKKYILINAKQYDDSSRWISITCYNQGDIFNLGADKHSAYIRYRKADGHSVLNSCRINYSGEVLVELTEQMLAASGICYVDLIIVNKGSAIVDIDTGEITTIDNSAIISTMAFCINVYEASFDSSVIESSDEYNAINELLQKVDADYKEVIQLARSYAIGDADDVRENEDYDNSKYYSRLARSYAVGDTDNIRENENVDNAKYYYEQALISANNAGESEANTLTYMNNANEHMNNAKTYMDNAATSEANAKISEINAKTSETNAATSEVNAKTSEDKALVSEINAKTSENNASVSETNARASETNAATSEQNAKTSETNSAASEARAKASESNAALSESNAAVSADNANASEQNAKVSETAARGYATTAQNSMYSASASASSASASATNAYNYYIQTEAITNGLNGAFMPMGTVTFDELLELKESGAVAAGYLYHISDNFTTDENFRTSGKACGAGTSVYYTVNDQFDCFVGTTVAGVKGKNETEYRTGMVDITAENVGAIPSENIATVDEIKNYLGI